MAEYYGQSKHKKGSSRNQSMLFDDEDKAELLNETKTKNVEYKKGSSTLGVIVRLLVIIACALVLFKGKSLFNDNLASFSVLLALGTTAFEFLLWCSVPSDTKLDLSRLKVSIACWMGFLYVCIFFPAITMSVVLMFLRWSFFWHIGWMGITYVLTITVVGGFLLFYGTFVLCMSGIVGTTVALNASDENI